MHIINIEIKATCRDPEKMKELLDKANADYKGEDHQVDTYFKSVQGRLKLRQGTIEKSLIYYDRQESKSLKTSNIILNRLTENDDILCKQLTEAMGIKVIVDKRRHIYFIDNVKLHIDRVDGLGDFVEIEAIGKKGEEDRLREQCQYYVDYLGIDASDFIDQSYSDLLLNQG